MKREELSHRAIFFFEEFEHLSWPVPNRKLFCDSFFFFSVRVGAAVIDIMRNKSQIDVLKPDGFRDMSPRMSPFISDRSRVLELESN